MNSCQSATFFMDKTIGENRVVRPDWSLCMGYELELRREAIKYTRERGMAIQEALWSAYHNEHHRLENFSNFLRLSGTPQVAEKDRASSATSKEGCGSGAPDAFSFSSRSQPPTGPACVFVFSVGKISNHLRRLLGRTSSRKGQLEGRGKGKSSGKSEGKASGPKQIQTFQQLIKMNKQTRLSLRAAHDEALGVCYSFQEHKCNKNPLHSCPHVCIGCGKGVPYNDCRRLSA